MEAERAPPHPKVAGALREETPTVKTGFLAKSKEMRVSNLGSSLLLSLIKARLKLVGSLLKEDDPLHDFLLNDKRKVYLHAPLEMKKAQLQPIL